MLRVGIGSGGRGDGADVGGVVAVVLAAEGAGVRGGRAHAGGPAVAGGERVVGPGLAHAPQPGRRRVPVPVRPPLAVRHHRAAVAAAVHRQYLPGDRSSLRASKEKIQAKIMCRQRAMDAQSC